MKIRIALAALLAAAVLAVPAASTQASVCNLITDRTGDAKNQLGADTTLDVVSADLGSNATHITAVFRLKKYEAVNPGTPQGRHYYLTFVTKNPTALMFLNVTLLQGGVARYAWGTVTEVPGVVSFYDDGQYGILNPATGVIDAAKNEIRVSALVKDVAAKGNVKPGSVLSKVTATTFYSVGFFIFEVDTASGKAPYTAGAASCVKPGS